MSEETTLRALAGLSRGAFLGALPELAGMAGDDHSARAGFAVRAAQELADRHEIGEREQAERLHSILATLDVRESGLRALAVACAGLPRGMKNTVASFLPVDLRPLLYGRPAASAGGAPRAPDRPMARAGTDPESGEADVVCSTVFLLSKEDNQACDHNRRLLKSNGFEALRLDDPSKLSDALSGSVDICACIIDKSFLLGLARPDQVSVFQELALYSSFLWVRVESEGLLIGDAELHELLRRARCQCTEPTAY